MQAKSKSLFQLLLRVMTLHSQAAHVTKMDAYTYSRAFRAFGNADHAILLELAKEKRYATNSSKAIWCEC